MATTYTARSASERGKPACVSCGGTGWWFLSRSWLESDGYKRERCHICGGDGYSSFRDDPAFVREQSRRRASRANEMNLDIDGGAS